MLSKVYPSSLKVQAGRPSPVPDEKRISERISTASPSRSLADEIGSLLGDGDRGRVRVASDDLWHDRRVDDAQALDPAPTTT